MIGVTGHVLEAVARTASRFTPDKPPRAACALERFQAKWIPVRVKKTRQIKNLEPRFDSIETEKALGGSMTKPTAEQIRQRAQEIREQNHRPDGRDDEFWYQAEKELSQGATSDEKSETFLE
jgi:hypothetical protein